jgi:hypothetical protein
MTAAHEQEQPADPLAKLIGDATVGLGVPPPEDATGAGRDAGGRDGGKDPDAGMWGSGFLVAPGWVLTCAHVLFDVSGRWARHRVRADGADIGVYVDGRVLRGRVAYAMPRPKPLPAGPEHSVAAGAAEPAAPEVFAETEEAERGRARDESRRYDLALVRLLDPLERERCVWLTDRQPGDPFREGVVAVRFPGPGGIHEPWISETYPCRPAGQLGTSSKFKVDSPLRKGTSGGVLVDVDRAEVIGLVKARARDSLSGIAVPVSDLRALTREAHVAGAADLGPAPYQELMRLHDTWHWERQRQANADATWIDAQLARQWRVRVWGPIDRLDALHHLGAVPQPADGMIVSGLVREAMEGRTVSAVPQLKSWRDGLGALSGIGDTEDLLVHLRYLNKVRAWAQRNGGAETDGDPLPGMVKGLSRYLLPDQRRRLETVSRSLRAVLLEFTYAEQLPAYPEEGEEDAAQYTWALYKGYENRRWELATPPPAEGRPFARAREDALTALSEVLAAARETRSGEDPVPVEVALPGREFASAFAEWRVREGLRASAPSLPLGDGQPVMLRDIERREVLADERYGPALERQWRERWEGLHHAGTLQPLRPVTRVADLTHAPHGSVPVLCEEVRTANGPGYAAVQRAVEVGYPVALWRVDGHSAEGGCGAECAAFHRRVRRLLGRAGGDGLHVKSLPERLWKLRNRYADTDPDLVAEGDAEWLRGLVLFFDSPEYPLPTPGSLLESP